MAEITTRKRTSRPSRAAAQLQAAPEQPKAEAPKAATPAKPKPQPMGPEGYRRKANTTGAALVAAAREHFGDEVKGYTDRELIEALGWATTAKTAIRKIAAKVAAQA